MMRSLLQRTLFSSGGEDGDGSDGWLRADLCKCISADERSANLACLRRLLLQLRHFLMRRERAEAERGVVSEFASKKLRSDVTSRSTVAETKKLES